jgi:shikimate kinase
MEDRATVWLVGMMGAGKSVVGHVLGERLRCRFIDADAEIERTAGASISEIFEREGEAGFRALERRTLRALAGTPAVVALGGGAIAQKGVAELLKRSGTVVYLRARPETLLDRVGQASERPLLARLDPSQRLDRLRTLLEQRASYYAKASCSVDTDGKSVEEVAAEVERHLNERGA